MGTLGQALCPPTAGARVPGQVTLEVLAAKAPRRPDLQAGQVPAEGKFVDHAAAEMQNPRDLFRRQQAFCQSQRTQVVCFGACTSPKVLEGKRWAFS